MEVILGMNRLFGFMSGRNGNDQLGLAMLVAALLLCAFAAAETVETPDYALTMARLARILREGEYDFAKGEVKLWTPPKNEAVTPAVA